MSVSVSLSCVRSPITANIASQQGLNVELPPSVQSVLSAMEAVDDEVLLTSRHRI